MKLQIALIGLCCVSFALGNEMSLQATNLESRNLNERANPMMMGANPMNHVMNQLKSMEKQMGVIQETLRRNHARKNSLTMRQLKDAMDEATRNIKDMSNNAMRKITSNAASLGGRSLGSTMNQQLAGLTSGQSSAAASTSSKAAANF
ncbi:uncharacterized protein LOC107369997 [Tetranychus urticae]|uniref:uncharacterized protein LOC107369997 n=1 Tax=Tetranychus urticae TaxID=32264 RepID=UPI00077B92FC|nr:uncharacterized protein LOC107369997 [Tetranychus urticae]